MAQKPPAWSPFDQAGQVPLMLSRDVDTTGVGPDSGQDPHTLAEQIVRQQQPVINRFVAMVRQQLEISGKDVHTATLPLPGMDVYYSQVQGLERMHYHISPQAEARPLPEDIIVEEPKIPAPPKRPEPLEPPEDTELNVSVEPDYTLIMPLGGNVSFLASGADGMWGSNDGVTWQAAPSSVRALNLAWIDNVWLANTDEGVMFSDDGAKSWKAVIGLPSLDDFFVVSITAMKPTIKGSDGKPLSGVFMIIGNDQNEPYTNRVFTSSDGAKTWDQVFTITQYDNGHNSVDGWEYLSGIGGGGGTLFITTTRQGSTEDLLPPQSNIPGSYGQLYVSMDGQTFSGPTKISPDGSPVGAIDTFGYEPGDVAYDETSKIYAMMMYHTRNDSSGITNGVYYKTSSTSIFDADEGTLVQDSFVPSGTSGGTFVSGGNNVAGGNKVFATGYVIQTSFTGIDDNLDEYGRFLPGDTVRLDSVPLNFSGRSVSSICFSKDASTPKDVTGDTTSTDKGKFAQISIALDRYKVWTAPAGGSWSMTHSGPALLAGAGNTTVACIGVGTLSFLGKESPPTGPSSHISSSVSWSRYATTLRAYEERRRRDRRSLAGNIVRR